MSLLAPLALAGLLLSTGSILFPPGSRLHEEPNVASLSVAVIDEETDLEPLEDRDGWVLVRYLDATGWVRKGPTYSLLSERGGSAVPPRGSRDEAILARTRARLSGREWEIGLGPLTLLTDVSDSSLTKELAAAAFLARFEIALRFGIVLPDCSGAVLILFAHPGDAPPDGGRACGRAGQRIAVATVEETTSGDRVARILHQAGHLFAVEALGDGIPPWLEEGLANAFVEAARSAGSTPFELVSLDRFWPESSSCGPEVEDLGKLLRSGPELFRDHADAACARQTAADLVRFLSDAWISDRPWRFRKFIGTFVEGETRLDVATLLSVLGEDLPSLEKKLQSRRRRH